MTLEEAMKMICDHRAKVKRTKDDWHDGYYDGLTAALMMLSEDEPADTDKPIWEAKDKMTLEELARGLRKIFRFRYLTLEHTGYISLWKNRPKYSEDFTGSGKTWRRGDDHICGLCAYLFPNSIDVELDLEEYEDADGNIDYSKFIVEVE